MKIFNDFKIATRAINTNKTRSFLTVLGIVIGVASIFIVFSAGEGLSSLILGQVESFGTNFIEVEIKVPTGKKGFEAEQQSGAALISGVQVTTLTLKDMDDILKLPNVKEGYSGIMSQDITSFESQKETANVLGVSPDYINIDNSEVESGQFFSNIQDRSLEKVVVLGSKIKTKLFGESDAVGKNIKIGKNKFSVIGVMKEKGASIGLDVDNYIIMPVRTLQKKVMGINHVLYSVYSLYDMDQAYATAEDVKYILRTNHNIQDETKDDFRVVTTDEMMKTLDTVTNTITLLLLAIVIISLVVAGVGITNVMYVIISERTSEIGLRKAVGANSSDIIRQFLIESTMITFIGFVVGFIIGATFSFLIALGAQYGGLDWKFSIPLRSIIVSFLFSISAGVIFGYFPAKNASEMEPVTALRNE